MRILRALTVFLVVLAACGNGGDESTVSSTEPAGSVDLATAFEKVSSQEGYRLRQSNAQTLASTALGVDTKTEIDLDAPDVVADVRGDRSHVVMDLSRVLGPMAGGVDGIALEMWTGPERIVIDSRSYQTLLDANPAAQLGPLAPGVAFIDVAALEADRPDLVAAIVGNGVADPAVLAERLPQMLDEADQIDERTVAGTAPYASVLEAFGADVEDLARGVAAGVALNLGVDPAALTRFYVDFYERTPTAVTVRIGSDDAVERISTKTDLSGVFDAMFRSGEELGLQISEAERREAQEQFADTVWELEVVAVFESVPDLVVPEPPATTDDRTAQWVELFAGAGG